jgi:hypothetical protein
LSDFHSLLSALTLIWINPVLPNVALAQFMLIKDCLVLLIKKEKENK